MRNIRTYTVVPNLPKRIEPLRDIAYNLYWSWHQEALELFKRVNEKGWRTAGHNPVALLGSTSQERLQAVARDEGFLAHLDRVKAELDEYLTTKTWYRTKYGDDSDLRVAYFSAEFGLHESLPIYSGGLGLLAGDHLKSASGLGLPLTGIGLFYKKGYCRQHLNADGWQQEFLHQNDFYNMPCKLVLDDGGKPIIIKVEFPNPDREVLFQIWRVHVGRVQLYLLDANIDANQPSDRTLTDQLYGGDVEHRIKQEVVLGVGGVRALKALNISPQVFHMNEGHSAFLAIERIRELVEEKGMKFDPAREAVTGGNVFTTHTPVPAGIDRFGPELIDRYFGSWYERLGCGRKTFLALGRKNPHDEREPFSMAILALKTANVSNGVSKLHGVVSRRMWNRLWPEVPDHEIPITSITNGVHIRSYVSEQLDELYTRYCGTRWSYEAGQTGIQWQGPNLLPDSELWRVHERRRWSLVTWVRKRLRQQLERQSAGPRAVAAAEEVLDPEALTIGFARRFATYKRGTLLFRDPERLARLLANKDRPMQIIFAGKAHPKDVEGKRLIQQVVHFAREERFQKHLVFLEDYDIHVARYLVQGVDVWLNTPRRPHEASGTSGMKAAANGALNLSILDGWWCEGYDGTNGWAIGEGEEYEDIEYQDDVECRALFDLLEGQVVPMFYERGPEQLPREWIARMKRAMQTGIPQFSTVRMVRDYTEKLYVPTGERSVTMNENDHQAAQELWDWKVQVFTNWAQIRIEDVSTSKTGEVAVGDKLSVHAEVHLGPIDPDWVDVQVYYGPLTETGNIRNGLAQSMSINGDDAPREGVRKYRGEIPCGESGRYGFTVRVLPRHTNMQCQFVPGLITWG